jgi:hypothetical protein
LLLFGPGAYLWFRQRRRAKPLLQLSIALACLLFLLFPVISVTDDLHAMRQEMEEPGPTKRALKQIVRRSVAPDLHAAAPDPSVSAAVLPAMQDCGAVQAFQSSIVASVGSSSAISRAPPITLLA